MPFMPLIFPIPSSPLCLRASVAEFFLPVPMIAAGIDRNKLTSA
jgi:hypothetical protein